MTITDCLPDYRLGFSTIIWFVFIFLLFMFGTIIIVLALKTSLINKKELYFSFGALLYGFGLGHLFIQIGIFYLDQFHFFLNLSLAIFSLINSPLIYYWEKNLTDLKKIPTIAQFFVIAISFGNFIFYLVTGVNFIENWVIFWMVLVVIANLFYFVLIIIFIKRTVGNLRIWGILFSIGFALIFIAGIFDHPPICAVNGLSPLVSPILNIIAFSLLFYCTVRIIDGITAFYKQLHTCTIHRGVISKDEQIYYCPSCTTAYCKKCYDQVILNDGCWNCGKGAAIDELKEKKSIQIKDGIGEKVEPKKKNETCL